MIIFLYGQNSYSLIQYVNKLISRYQKKYPGSFNLHKFDLEEDDQNEVRNAVRENSFFKQVKFVIVKNPMANSGFIEKVIRENNIGKQKETVLLLYQSETEKDLKEKSQKTFDLLKKEAQVKEFKPPTTQMTNKFAADYLAENKISIEKEILVKLIKETGPDLWRLKNELDKITSFAGENPSTSPSTPSASTPSSAPRGSGPRGSGRVSINEEDLAKLVNFKIDSNIFSIIEAPFSNQAKALVLFDDYLAKGGDPLYLLSMIAFQLKNMLIVRELMDKGLQYGQILKKTGMHPFFFKKNYEAAKRHPLDNLKKIFQKTVNFEMALKTGQTEAENLFFKIFL